MVRLTNSIKDRHELLNGTPSVMLMIRQVLKASRALLKHIATSERAADTAESKQNLLADGDDADSESAPVFLTLTTKKHIIDAKRLKPALLSIPHPLQNSPNTSICLITADPQRTYKDLVASPTFPADLAKRITRVIGVTKLKKKYSQYEAQRQLYAEHDIFLADDRIITRLSSALGKTFYKNTTKRPIPVALQPPAPRSEGKRIARVKGDEAPRVASAEVVAKEIQKALNAALVHLSPSTHTAVKIGYAAWSAERLAENVEAVVDGLVTKFVPGKWRGVRGLHLKGQHTAALPVWLADELWSQDEDVVEKTIDSTKKANVGKKRKAIEGLDSEEPTTTKGKKQKAIKQSDDTRLDEEIAMRKEILKKQKDALAMDVEDDIPVPVQTATGKSKTKSRKAKKVEA